MTIWRPGYCNRYDVQRSVDFKPGIDVFDRIDRALMSSAEEIEGSLHRVFYPSDDTRFFDWPNQGGSGGGQYADPWRLWLDDNDLACLTALASGGVAITLDQVFVQPWSNPAKFRPYYSYIELDRATNAQFGNNSQTPQNAISMSGTWGYGADADPAGTLAADVGLDDATVTVSDGSKAAPGDLIILGYGRGTAPFPALAPHAGAVRPFLGERCLITDVSPVATGLTQDGSGVSGAADNDVALSWAGDGTLNAGEVITLDQEDMLVEKVAGGVATVRRAFNGTTLASHSGAPVWAMRQYSVLRAQLGTTGAAYTAGAAVSRHRVPQLVRDLSIAQSENQVLQEGSGYARTTGTGDASAPAPGAGIGAKWMAARARHGRKARQRAV